MLLTECASLRRCCWPWARRLRSRMHPALEAGVARRCRRTSYSSLRTTWGKYALRVRTPSPWLASPHALFIDAASPISACCLACSSGWWRVCQVQRCIVSWQPSGAHTPHRRHRAGRLRTHGVLRAACVQPEPLQHPQRPPRDPQRHIHAVFRRHGSASSPGLWAAAGVPPAVLQLLDARRRWV